MLSDEKINELDCVELDHSDWNEVRVSSASTHSFARAIESAATAPLLERIAELEKALKLVQQHHATAWNRGHIAGMAANRMVARDAMKAVEQDAWNNTQLTEALMAAEKRSEELELELEAVRNEVLEEAAKCCDGVYYQNIGPLHGEVRYGIAACSSAIRSLKTDPNDKLTR